MRATTVLGSVALGLVTAGLSLTCAPQALASTYYVSPSGSDSNAGTQAKPWKSITKVNQASLSPGDSVLFQGGAVWHGTLQPVRSGTASSPITFGSYGSGQPVIDGTGAGDTAISLSHTASYLRFQNFEIRNFKNGGNAVYVAGGSHLTFSNIDSHDNSNGFWDSSQAQPSTDVTITGSTFSGMSSGIQLYIGNLQSTGWQVTHDEFADSGDSCIIDVSADTVYDTDVIHHCGFDPKVHTNKHGIYARGQNITIRNSQVYDIDEDSYGGQCISQREGGLIEGNQLHGCLGGIGWFDYTRAAKQTLTIRRNQIWDYRYYGIYLDTVYTNGENQYNVKGHSMTFLLSNNTIVSTAQQSDGIDFAGAASGYKASVDIENTIVTGNLEWAMSVFDKDKTGTFTGRKNVYWSTNGRTTFKSHAVPSTAVVNGDAGSIIADPQLASTGSAASASTFSLRSSSPAIDFGVADPQSGTLKGTCDGSILSYCGRAPDAGAQESAAGGRTAAARQLPRLRERRA